MISGIINMNKEKGYTSHDVVAKMRGILKMKKIGHTGTLDPDACGVLPICLGKATKVVDLIVNKDKTYEAILKLGLTTDTQDMTGQVITSCPVNVSLSQIEDAISNFVGGYDQIPPMYSALKVNGKKLYELARQGKEIERKPRRIHIHDINLLDCNLDENEVKIRVSCGKGTYIRTLIHDIGKLLGCGATMKSLVRTAVGEFDIDNALSLNQVEEYKLDGSLYNYVISVDDMFPSYPKLIVDSRYHSLIHNGNTFLQKHVDKERSSVDMALLEPEEGLLSFRVYDSNMTFVGIYNYDWGRGLFTVKKMFI
ncbi:MAG: tRNA pseudouridine(55) synthase TruB [Clostridiales bacterium]|nr:tRNA pseudouridine(55) synthase TruB [Clostridiales bacterium]